MKYEEDNRAFIRGYRDALPIFISYFAVSLAVGINAKNAGLSAFQASLMSFLNLTSTGQAAGIEIIRQHGTYIELIMSQLAINLRYLLMGTALAVRLRPGQSLGRRLMVSIGITDEIFALSSSVAKPLSPLYVFGCYCMSMPGWVLGTFTGAQLGNILPQTVVSAMSIALYAMFTYLVIEPARKSRILMSLVVISMLLSLLTDKLLPSLSFGMKVIILTVVISSAAALLFPVKDEDEKEDSLNGQS
ncbi:MAG: AzlC family ABC transporter permease [Sphaerochaetaceae bacterium]|nr:AzlC family ABC transporter permease [Sphaerochaetaceae bacterium]